MTYQRYCQRKADIAFRLGLHPDQVTTDHVFDYELGCMDEGAACTLWPMRASSISSGPYYSGVAAPAAVGNALRATAESFDEADGGIA